jgi:crotonobetainyl-CoA hydratase
MSIRASKQAVMTGLNTTLPQAMIEQREYPAVRDMIQSEDYVEGPRAFAEKRPPRWRGK